MSLPVFCYQGLLLAQTRSDVEFLGRQYALHPFTNYTSRMSSSHERLDTFALLSVIVPLMLPGVLVKTDADETFF